MRRESSAAWYTMLLEILLQCTSWPHLRHASSLHRPGNQNLLAAQKVLQAPLLAGYDPGETCDSLAANSNSQPGTSVHPSPQYHMAQPCAASSHRDANDTLWQCAAAAQLLR